MGQFLALFAQIWAKMNFSQKRGSVSFLIFQLSTISPKIRKKLLSHFWKKTLIDGQVAVLQDLLQDKSPIKKNKSKVNRFLLMLRYILQLPSVQKCINPWKFNIFFSPRKKNHYWKLGKLTKFQVHNSSLSTFKLPQETVLFPPAKNLLISLPPGEFPPPPPTTHTHTHTPKVNPPKQYNNCYNPMKT